MYCPKCNYLLDSLDKQCPRCINLSASTGAATQALPEDAADKVIDFFKYPSGKPTEKPPSSWINQDSSQQPIPTTLPAIGNEWYYAENGKRIGPCTQEQVYQLIQNGTLRRNMMVWNPNMPDWQQASLSSLGELFPILDRTPPPLAAGEVNNTYVWLLAFAPLVTSLILNVLSGGARWDQSTAQTASFLFPFIVNIGLSMWDEKQLRNAGHDMEGINGAVCFLVPIYLFMRASKLRHSNAYAWVWLACFLISFAIPVTYYR